MRRAAQMNRIGVNPITIDKLLQSAPTNIIGVNYQPHHYCFKLSYCYS